MAKLFEAIKAHFSFSKLELQAIAIVAVVLGFVFSFREWGVERFELSTGLLNWLTSALITVLVLLVYLSVQRIVALRIGYKAEFRLSPWALLAVLAITFITRGLVPVAAAGRTLVYHTETRLGRFHYELSYRHLGLLALLGPLAAICLAVLFKLIGFAAPANAAIAKTVAISALFASWNMLPLPGLDGMNVLFGSRTLWAFAFVAIVAASVLLYLFTSVALALGAAIIVAALAAALWFVYLEAGL